MRLYGISVRVHRMIGVPEHINKVPYSELNMKEQFMA